MSPTLIENEATDVNVEKICKFSINLVGKMLTHKIFGLKINDSKILNSLNDIGYLVFGCLG